ncbi:Na+/H+ antiporter subunit E [Candidatus Eisenbacteria bacterium]|uniref:Na+/H+ antiporter subunit E n=1 Tax=Eiseniibacteriota bacterium TaxID=2212470 RepID=A0ABV6YJS9_UNCEI
MTDSDRNRSTQIASAPPGSAGKRLRATVLLIVGLALLWVISSGKLDFIHSAYGVLSILLVLLLTRTLTGSRSDPSEDEVFARIHVLNAIIYPFWLLWQITLANMQLAGFILAPKMPIDPVLLRFKTGMKSPIAKVTLGNSITLTPGTFTIRIRGDEFLVHAVHESMAAGLLDGSMQRKVAGVYRERELDPLDVEVIRDMDVFRREEGL